MNRRTHPGERRPATARRGAIMAEAALVMLVMAFFVLLAPAVWRIWDAHQRAGTKAHRMMFEQACTFYDHSLAPAPSADAKKPLVPRITASPYLGYYPLAQLTGLLGKKKGQTHLDFPNEVTEGLRVQPVQYDASLGALRFAGGMNVTRRGYVLRQPWAWASQPFVQTQSPGEEETIQAWYTFGYDYTMKKLPGRLLPIEGLHLSD